MSYDHRHRAAGVAGRAPDAASGLATSGPSWQSYAEYWRMVRRQVRGPRERLRCYARLIGWLAVDRNAIRLLLGPVGRLDRPPGALISEIGQRMLMGMRGAQVRRRQR